MTQIEAIESGERRNARAKPFAFASSFAVATACAAVVAAASLVWLAANPSRVVHAQGSGSSDPDGDGLPTSLELVIGTDPTYPDSDVDGYSDAEEIARHSSPVAAWETPPNQTASIGLNAVLGVNGIHIIACMYFQDGDLSSKHIQVGYMLNGQLAAIGPSVYKSQPTITIVPAAVPGELVAVYEVVVSPVILRRYGAAGLYVMATGPNNLKVADAVNLYSSNGVIGQRLTTTTQSGGSPGTTLHVASGGGGTVFRPLGGQAIPPAWTPGTICMQTTQVVGYVGATMTQEVTDANCQSGWDAFCDPSCSASVGSTQQLLDPGVLAGG